MQNNNNIDEELINEEEDLLLGQKEFFEKKGFSEKEAKEFLEKYELDKLTAEVLEIRYKQIPFFVKFGFSEKGAIEFLEKNNLQELDNEDLEERYRETPFFVKHGFSQKNALEFLEKNNLQELDNEDLEERYREIPFFVKHGFSQKNAIEFLEKNRLEKLTSIEIEKRYIEIPFLAKYGFSGKNAIEYLEKFGFYTAKYEKPEDNHKKLEEHFIENEKFYKENNIVLGENKNIEEINIDELFEEIIKDELESVKPYEFEKETTIKQDTEKLVYHKKINELKPIDKLNIFGDENYKYTSFTIEEKNKFEKLCEKYKETKNKRAPNGDIYTVSKQVELDVVTFAKMRSEMVKDKLYDLYVKGIDITTELVNNVVADFSAKMGEVLEDGNKYFTCKPGTLKLLKADKDLAKRNELIKDEINSVKNLRDVVMENHGIEADFIRAEEENGYGNLRNIADEIIGTYPSYLGVYTKEKNLADTNKYDKPNKYADLMAENRVPDQKTIEQSLNILRLMDQKNKMHNNWHKFFHLYSYLTMNSTMKDIKERLKEQGITEQQINDYLTVDRNGNRSATKESLIASYKAAAAPKLEIIKNAEHKNKYEDFKKNIKFDIVTSPDFKKRLKEEEKNKHRTHSRKNIKVIMNKVYDNNYEKAQLTKEEKDFLVNESEYKTIKEIAIVKDPHIVSEEKQHSSIKSLEYKKAILEEPKLRAKKITLNNDKIFYDKAIIDCTKQVNDLYKEHEDVKSEINKEIGYNLSKNALAKKLHNKEENDKYKDAKNEFFKNPSTEKRKKLIDEYNTTKKALEAKKEVKAIIEEQIKSINKDLSTIDEEIKNAEKTIPNKIEKYEKKFTEKAAKKAAKETIKLLTNVNKEDKKILNKNIKPGNVECKVEFNGKSGELYKELSEEQQNLVNDIAFRSNYKKITFESIEESINDEFDPEEFDADDVKEVEIGKEKRRLEQEALLEKLKKEFEEKNNILENNKKDSLGIEKNNEYEKEKNK